MGVTICGEYICVFLMTDQKQFVSMIIVKAEEQVSAEFPTQ